MLSFDSATPETPFSTLKSFLLLSVMKILRNRELNRRHIGFSRSKKGQMVKLLLRFNSVTPKTTYSTFKPTTLGRYNENIEKPEVTQPPF